MELEGEANDYVGKGFLVERLIVAASARCAVFIPDQTVLVGNTVLYGATSARLISPESRREIRRATAERSRWWKESAITAASNDWRYGRRAWPHRQELRAGMSGGSRSCIDRVEELEQQ